MQDAPSHGPPNFSHKLHFQPQRPSTLLCHNLFMTPSSKTTKSFVPNLTCTARYLRTTQVLWNLQGFPCYVRGPSTLMFAIIIFVNMCKKGFIKIFPVDTKDQFADALTKALKKITFNVIATTCVASNLHKQPKWGSDTYLEYFSTYLGYLPTNPMSQHSDTFPANPSWIPDIPRHCLLRN